MVEGFNASSPPGDPTKPVVFVDDGLEPSYQEPAEAGASVKGTIVPAQDGNSARATPGTPTTSACPARRPGSGSPGGQYHTGFDDNDNQDHVLDPTHGGQAGTTKVMGLVALRLANANIPQFDDADYAAQVNAYLNGLTDSAKAAFGGGRLSLSGARNAANAGKKAAQKLNTHTTRLLANSSGSRAQYAVATGALMSNERALIAPDGPAQRPLVPAPDLRHRHQRRVLGRVPARHPGRDQLRESRPGPHVQPPC